jgi:iron-sulfur cluster insertion protein
MCCTNDRKSMTEIVQAFEPSVIQLTDGAAKKVKSLISEEGNPNLKLRVFVTGGGCSGFQYGFSFDETSNDDDTVVINQGANLLVDPLSIQYLMGAKVDYVEGLQGSRFVVENPMATTTCGCGMSFSV